MLARPLGRSGELVQLGGHDQPDGGGIRPRLREQVEESALGADERHAGDKQVVDRVHGHRQRLPSEVDQAQPVKPGELSGHCMVLYNPKA
jgi:hypothetical protein